MGKTDKELAVDVAIAYTTACGNRRTSSGQSTPLYTVQQVEEIITHVYNTLGKLDEENK